MMPTTPSGTRTWRMRRPFGRTQPSVISPTGSASAATVAQPAGHAFEAGRRQAQAVDHGRRDAGAGRPLDVDGVGRQDIVATVDEQVGGGVEGGVLGRRRSLREQPRGSSRPLSELADGIGRHAVQA